MVDRIIAYPAVLSDKDNDKGTYTVTFPDVPGAISDGVGMAKALYNGSEALGLMLYDEKELPNVSSLDVVRAKYPDDTVSLISVDLNETALNVRAPLVKKNTTLPADIVKLAEAKNINFSETLTKALKKKLNV